MRRAISHFAGPLFLVTVFATVSRDLIADSCMNREVVVQGSGNSREAAIREALRLAVQQVIGGRFSSQTEVRNGFLTEQCIHFHADGVVQHFTILDEERRGDRVLIRLNATVREGAGSAPQGHLVDGEQLLALAETNEQRRTTAADTLPEFLKRWPEKVTVVTPATTEPTQVSTETDEIEVRQAVEIIVNRSRYGSLVTELMSLLGTVAVARGRFDALMAPLSTRQTSEWLQARLGNRILPEMAPTLLRHGIISTCQGFRPMAGGDNLLKAAETDRPSILVFVKSSPGPTLAVDRWHWFLVPIRSGFSLPHAELELLAFDDLGRQIASIQRPLGDFVPGWSFQPHTFGHAVPSLVIAPTCLIHSGTISHRNSLVSIPGLTVTLTYSLPRAAVSRMRRLEGQLRCATAWDVLAR